MTLPSGRRKALVPHTCSGCTRAILPGEMYLRHNEFPGDDAGYATAAGHPVTHAECRDCAERYGRGHILDGAA